MIADIRRDRVLFFCDVFKAAPIQLLGGNAGDNLFGDHFQYFCREFSGNAHLFDLLGVF